MEDFNHQNAVYDLTFEFQDRGTYRDGRSLPPHIAVRFEQAFGMALCFRCMRVEAVARKSLGQSGQEVDL
jgi:hypothetical protein